MLIARSLHKNGYLKKVGLVMLFLAYFVPTLKTQDLAECIIENGTHFIGQPYEAGTLDKNNIEALVCDAASFDCVTFVEYVLALSYYQIQINPKQNLEEILTKIRYRDGKIDGYTSRIHYFTEWIIAQEQAGRGKDITKEIGGIPSNKTINFMSKNRNKYPKLVPERDLDHILNIEERITSHVRHYIPKNKLHTVQDKIKDGDIIGITTSIEGLDIVHTGFAHLIQGVPHLLHASVDEKKVVITKLPLYKYLENNKLQSGVMVFRPKG